MDMTFSGTIRQFDSRLPHKCQIEAHRCCPNVSNCGHPRATNSSVSVIQCPRNQFSNNQCFLGVDWSRDRRPTQMDNLIKTFAYCENDTNRIILETLSSSHVPSIATLRDRWTSDGWETI